MLLGRKAGTQALKISLARWAGISAAVGNRQRITLVDYSYAASADGCLYRGAAEEVKKIRNIRIKRRSC
ncbi:hypothetical protein KP17_17915 [Pectobacterium parvum]|nr:hypothetical protein A8F97_14540 [Pectobacterium parmentieri]KFX10683.1 hypothetical protein KP17_17915 [Pectobacterium parvum]